MFTINETVHTHRRLTKVYRICICDVATCTAKSIIYCIVSPHLPSSAPSLLTTHSQQVPITLCRSDITVSCECCKTATHQRLNHHRRRRCTTQKTIKRAMTQLK